MHNLIRYAVPYFQPKILGIFFLGFSSGLPFLLTLATLHMWLADAGISKSTIGLFVLITVPYSCKFIWAPFIDRTPIPLFSDLFGHLKGWMIFSQLALIISLIALGQTDPQINIFSTAICAFLVSFFSATQDIVVESYRIERLSVAETGYGAGATNLGYRLGMWVSGAGALYLASLLSWEAAYAFMALLMIIGLVTASLSIEPLRGERDIMNYRHGSVGFWSWYKKIVTPAFVNLYRKDSTLSLCIFILLFKFVDTAINVMAVPFLIEIGFTKLQIAHVGKSFGIGAMIVGGVLGGALLSTQPLEKTIKLSFILQLVAALLFYVQASLGANIYFLFATIGVENLCNGIATAAFITLMSHAARGPNSALNFAMLASFASLARVFFSFISGNLAELISWQQYYIIVALFCLPSLFMLSSVYQKMSSSFDNKSQHG